jgi:2,3,4,5-tetrahydropyridine-2-carboxylate N-succinyltransferase
MLAPLPERGYSADMELTEIERLVSEAFNNRELLKQEVVQAAIKETLRLLDQGKIRVASQNAPGDWTTHAWIKQAVLLYFAIAEMKKMVAGPFEFYDKIPLKHELERFGVRVVPPGTVRYGSFIEPGAIVVEGMLIEREAVIGAGVSLTASTAIIDVTGSEPVEYRGRVPSRSVVIPGMREKAFPAGRFQVACALIIGQRKESTDKKTSLNAALRDFSVAV